jgi:hypothetical protein
MAKILRRNYFCLPTLAFGMDTFKYPITIYETILLRLLEPCLYASFFSFVRHGHKILTNLFGWMDYVYEMDAWMDSLQLASTRTTVSLFST